MNEDRNNTPEPVYITPHRKDHKRQQTYAQTSGQTYAEGVPTTTKDQRKSNIRNQVATFEDAFMRSKNLRIAAHRTIESIATHGHPLTTSDLFDVDAIIAYVWYMEESAADADEKKRMDFSNENDRKHIVQLFEAVEFEKAWKYHNAIHRYKEQLLENGAINWINQDKLWMSGSDDSGDGGRGEGTLYGTKIGLKQFKMPVQRITDEHAARMKTISAFDPHLLLLRTLHTHETEETHRTGSAAAFDASDTNISDLKFFLETLLAYQKFADVALLQLKLESKMLTNMPISGDTGDLEQWQTEVLEVKDVITETRQSNTALINKLYKAFADRSMNLLNDLKLMVELKDVGHHFLKLMVELEDVGHHGVDRDVFEAVTASVEGLHNYLRKHQEIERPASNVPPHTENLTQVQHGNQQDSIDDANVISEIENALIDASNVGTVPVIFNVGSHTFRWSEPPATTKRISQSFVFAFGTAYLDERFEQDSVGRLETLFNSAMQMCGAKMRADALLRSLCPMKEQGSRRNEEMMRNQVVDNLVDAWIEVAKFSGDTMSFNRKTHRLTHSMGPDFGGIPDDVLDEMSKTLALYFAMQGDDRELPLELFFVQ